VDAQETAVRWRWRWWSAAAPCRAWSSSCGPGVRRGTHCGRGGDHQDARPGASCERDRGAVDLQRHPEVQDRWSRKHGDSQRRLCQRFAAPVIATVTAGLDNPPAVQASVAAHGTPPSIAVEHRAAALVCYVSPHSGPRACRAPRDCAAHAAWRVVPDRAGPSPLDRWGRVDRVGIVGCWFGGCGGAGVCRARCWQLARW
jgi:hypothetical protein